MSRWDTSVDRSRRAGWCDLSKSGLTRSKALTAYLSLHDTSHQGLRNRHIRLETNGALAGIESGQGGGEFLNRGTRIERAMRGARPVADEEPPVQAEGGDTVTDAFFSRWDRCSNNRPKALKCGSLLGAQEREVRGNCLGLGGRLSLWRHRSWRGSNLTYISDFLRAGRMRIESLGCAGRPFRMRGTMRLIEVRFDPFQGGKSMAPTA